MYIATFNIYVCSTTYTFYEVRHTYFFYGVQSQQEQHSRLIDLSQIKIKHCPACCNHQSSSALVPSQRTMASALSLESPPFRPRTDGAFHKRNTSSPLSHSSSGDAGGGGQGYSNAVRTHTFQDTNGYVLWLFFGGIVFVFCCTRGLDFRRKQIVLRLKKWTFWMTKAKNLFFTIAELFMTYCEWFFFSHAQNFRETLEIRNVWEENVEEEMAIIRELIETHPYVAMDTEFPGVVARPVSETYSPDFHYKSLKCNVDLLKIIQLGLTFADVNGNFAKG